jgi:hypothetical protein
LVYLDGEEAPDPTQPVSSTLLNRKNADSSHWYADEIAWFRPRVSCCARDESQGTWWKEKGKY